MTPQEKARELVDKYINVDIPSCWLKQEDAKTLALIAVDEIMKSGCTQPSSVAYYGDNEEAIRYWEEVKQEIEKL